MKNRPNGFTLIELLVVVAIVAILAALAVPSFNTMMMKRSVRSAAISLVDDMRYARSEALRRSLRVSICSLAANSTNTCSAAGAANWANGWVVFSDMANTGIVNTVNGEEIVRVQQPLVNIATIEDTPASDKHVISFEANGRARPGGNQTFRITPRGTVPANTVRIVCVSNQGRVRLLDEGATTCS
ncbi:MAG: GspH/FimT family pseudopilin [Pseudomonadota bacterium]